VLIINIGNVGAKPPWVADIIKMYSTQILNSSCTYDHTYAFINLYWIYMKVHCEWSSSKLKIIKTRMMSSLNQELLEPLLLINIESDIIPNIEEIINCYVNSSSKLQTLLYYLSILITIIYYLL
jgi:hypothetical protein